MGAPISRRRFFCSLVPGWATRRNLVAGAIGAGVVIAVSVVVAGLREVGFLSVLKVAMIGQGLVCVLWLFGRIASAPQPLQRSAFARHASICAPVGSLVILLLLLVGCHGQSPRERWLSHPRGGGVSASWPAMSVEVTSVDSDVDLPPVLKARMQRLDVSGERFCSGKARVKLSVSVDGTVTKVSVLESSDQACTDNALRELKTCRFFPARRRGAGVESAIECAVTFYYIDE